jgi:cytochrome c biogenesis protein CcdA
MMRVNLEPYAVNGTEAHSDRYARAEGGSPIVLEVWPGTLSASASSEQMVPPEEGGLFRSRSFHLGLAETHNLAGTAFLGTGAAVQQNFTVLVEVHYG